jgi:hypothetical protein
MASWGDMFRVLRTSYSRTHALVLVSFEPGFVFSFTMPSETAKAGSIRVLGLAIEKPANISRSYRLLESRE